MREAAALIARLAAVMLLAWPLWSRAEPLLIHLHGLAFSPDGRSLLASSHAGLTAWGGESWSHELESGIDITGFAVTARALYASGHPPPGSALRNPLGLAGSVDGTRWQALALEGEADFHLIAASYRAQAIYVLSHLPNRVMPAPGVHLTRDEGATWARAAARGLAGEVLALAAHPTDPATVAAATDRGLFVSTDAGQRFRRLYGRQAATAVAFALDGRRVLFTPALSNEILFLALGSSGPRGAIRLPPMRGDYATHLALHPADARIVAVGSRRRDVYLSADGGSTWRQIAREGDLP